MALTVAAVRMVAARRCGPWAALADANDALARALVSLGVVPVNMLAVVDGDLAGLTGDMLPQLLDVIEYHTAESACANCDEAELRRVGIFEDPAKLAGRLERHAARRLEFLRRAYNYGLAPLVGGTIAMDFQARNDDVPDPAF